jgi:exonuclease V gamma subunit
MSTLFLASDPRSLADRLADALDADAKTGDFFAPTRVVVPNRFLRKWLRLWLARKLDVAINLTYQTLEEALWQLVQEADPNRSASPPEAIDSNVYRLMALSVLLEEQDPDLAPLQRYVQMQGSSLSRLSCRRAWYLADRVGALLQEYEYHRQDAFIRRWLRDEFGLGAARDSQKRMERAQRSLFQHITHEPDGRRALLNRLGEQSLKTFPQYAMEIMEPGAPRVKSGGIVHFFGFTQLSELHARTVGWLGQSFDIRFYHLNVLASRLPETLQSAELNFHVQSMRDAPQENDELLHDWGRAGLESLTNVANGLARPGFAVEVLPAYEPPRISGRRNTRTSTVLGRLQDRMLGKSTAKTRLHQDTSLQIAGCPGAMREVETVYNSILHNLQTNPSLRQTDIAVLVTDMPRYRVPLQAVFERPPARIQYNLVDFNAAGASTFGQALLGMIDLALESFSRVRVFEVILNPCFLARLGVDRASATTWLEWAEQLGIYQGWDAEEKQQQGYASSPLYAWRLGLQRLRLGRYMEVTREDGEEPAPRFAHVIPFADIASTEREPLDAFCRAVEGLLPSLAGLRSKQASGQRWATVLQRLMREFLEVPSDRPEEAQVRDELLAAARKLAQWDHLRDSTHKEAGLPLALVREYVLSQLELLQANRGEYLVGGVTIATLQPMRPVPFAIIYVLGLGDDLFPGSNAPSSFDLRGVQRLPGDILPAEGRLHDFLTTVLSAQQKLYLLYNNHDLQKDQALLPAVPVQQLQRYLKTHILREEFQPIKMPAHGDDPGFLDSAQHPAYQDLLVQYGESERCLAVLAAQRTQQVTLDATQQAEWSPRYARFQKNFAIPQEATEMPPAAATVTLRELRDFLYLPARASLRRHLHVDDDDTQSIDEDEPLVTSQQAASGLMRQTIQRLILSAGQGGVEQALASWEQQFAETFADSRLRSRAPEAAFGEIDQAALLGELRERIHGQGQIEAFLKEHAGMEFCGPVLIGESTTPIGAQRRFPALRLRPGHELPADAPREFRIVGWTPFVWLSADRLEVLALTNGKKFEGSQIAAPMLDPALFHLTLLAGAEAGTDGIAAQHWLGKREVALHVAHAAGIQTWVHAPGSITAAEATCYLAELARDLLEPAQFDLLPFDIIAGNKELQLTFRAGIAMSRSADDFRTLLEDAIADARDSEFERRAIPFLVDMIGAKVPADALAKVQRRFQLLDRGPARLREHPAPAKPRKKAKP